MTRKTFDLIVISYIGLRLTEALVKMWARRRLADETHGVAEGIAGAVVADLS